MMLRNINLFINIVVILITLAHEMILFRNQIYEWVQLRKSIFLIKIAIELFFIAIIVPPFKLPMISWGQGYGKNDLFYSIHGFILILFLIVRAVLIIRIVNKYSKFRSYRSEQIIKSYFISNVQLSFKAILMKYNFRIVVILSCIVCYICTISNFVLE